MAKIYRLFRGNNGYCFIAFQRHFLRDELTCSVPMKELQNHDFRVAFWTEDNKIWALYRIDGKYYSIQVDDFMKLWGRIFKSVSQNLGTEEGVGAES